MCEGNCVIEQSGHGTVTIGSIEKFITENAWENKWVEPIKIKLEKKQSVGIIGGGPAGLECALSLGKRGYRVILAEASEYLGGRVHKESRLPGLAEWGRVTDYRVTQLEKMDNVTLYRGSKLDTGDIIEFSSEDKFGYSHVFLATGASWRRDGVAREHRNPIPGLENITLLTPDDLMDGVSVSGSIVIFDDEHYYMGGVLAEKIRLEGHKVLLVTPAPDISNWTHHTMEQRRIQSRLLELEVELATQQNLISVNSKEVELACVFTDRRTSHECDTLVLVTERLPNDEIYNAMLERQEELAEVGIKTHRCIGDCFAPGIIAAAVHSGHLAAREFEDEITDDVPFRRERVVV